MAQEKIKPVGEDNLSGSNPAFSNDEVGGVKKDVGMVGIVISILAVFLLVVFYYSMNKNMDALSDEVGQITETRQMVQDLDTKMGEMDARIAELENLPEVVRSMVLGGMLEEMNQKAGYIGAYVTDEQKAKLEQARELMKQIQEELTAQ
jgi:hypothetical protein